MILAGDIGGTNTRLALFEGDAANLAPAVTEVFQSRTSEGLEAILKAFREKDGQPIEAAAFGIAGPVLNGRCQTPNLPWIVEAVAVANALELSSVSLVNDLEANAHGISALAPLTSPCSNLAARTRKPIAP